MKINSGNVLYEDNHLIAINKESGVLVQGDKTGDIPLLDLVKSYVKIKYNKPGDVFLGVIHRIDRPVSGLVLMARTSKGLERMNKAFKERDVQKTYLAVVRNPPSHQTGTLIHYLTKDSEKNIATAHIKEVKNSLHAELSYELIGEKNGFYLLKVNPLTGRPHQIRVQLSSMDCPIVGDNKYGYPRGNKDKSICLHAYQLKIKHPVKDEDLLITAPLPKDDFWKKFEDLL